MSSPLWLPAWRPRRDRWWTPSRFESSHPVPRLTQYRQRSGSRSRSQLDAESLSVVSWLAMGGVVPRRSDAHSAESSSGRRGFGGENGGLSQTTMRRGFRERVTQASQNAACHVIVDLGGRVMAPSDGTVVLRVQAPKSDTVGRSGSAASHLHTL